MEDPNAAGPVKSRFLITRHKNEAQPDSGVSENYTYASDTPEAFWLLADMIQRYGGQTVYDIASMFAMLSKGTDNLTDDEAQAIRGLINLAAIPGLLVGGDPVELALQHTYRMLYERQITREQAAHLAASWINKPVTTEAWRKRVDRWAEDQGKPKIEQPRGRPRKHK